MISWGRAHSFALKAVSNLAMSPVKRIMQYNIMVEDYL